MAEKNGSTKKGQHELREYQLEMLEAAKEKNIIVCLGTGTGKTFISIKLIEHLAQVNHIDRPFSEGGKRTFFLVTSVPLVFQQAKAIELHTALNVKPYCGEMGVDFWTKDVWLKEFEENHVLVMTHQIYLDLLQHAKLRLSHANLLVFDECHHATKKHPFKKIMDIFAGFPEKDHPRILGLTASVVGKKVKPYQIPDEIKKLERTLRSVCKTASDPNVVEIYGAKPQEFMRTYSSSNHLDDIAKYLEQEFASVLKPFQAFLQDMKVVKNIFGSEEVVMKEVHVAKSAVRECLSASEDIGIWAAYEVSKMLISDLEKRHKKVINETVSLVIQATLTILRELGLIYNEFNIANMAHTSINQDYLKPKVKELLKLFASSRDAESEVCSIVFVERRYAACVVSKLINTLARTDPQQYGHLTSDFVTGHGSELWGISETEMNYNKQKEKLENFGKDFNVLVGTSVVEEGVDIPKCNLVVMFDFPKNYRAFVQSRGRGRAKDARYILLVSKSERSQAKQEQERYQQVDKYLTALCQGSRDEPTDEEIEEVINEYPLETYFTARNARLDMQSAVSLLFRYYSSLPCDRYTRLKPLFKIHDLDGEFQCTLKMPGNSLVTGVIKGEAMLSKEDARRAVAQKACEMLHKKGALNDNLLPVQSSSESESDGEDETDGTSLHKTGTRKRQREHIVKTSEQLYGRLTPDGSKSFHVYAIKMEFDEVCNMVKKRLWDRKNVSLGIITTAELPKLAKFHLYNDIGKLTVSVERCRPMARCVLTQGQRDLVDWFHRFIFTETLEFNLGPLTTNGCRVVLLKCDGPSCLSSSRPSHSASPVSDINFDEMEILKEKALGNDGRCSSDTDFLDSVVIQGYLTKPGHWMVISVTEDTPCSPFPNQSKARTFLEHHERTHFNKIKDLSQPLLKVIHHSRKIYLHSKKDNNRKRVKDRSIIKLIPETLTFRSSPQSLTLRALFLPAVLYRLDSLVSISELRDSVTNEIVTITSSKANVNTPESPRKKPKFNFDLEELDLTDGEGDTSSEATTSETSLSRFFYPFDSSKQLPLFQLLEAVTCANSGEDFDLERLEMLGDSFLKMAVSIHVYWHKDHKDEGKLTKYRTRQISNKNLYNLAVKRDLAKYIKYSVLSKEKWLPPGFTPPREEEDVSLSSSSDDDFDFPNEDVIQDHTEGINNNVNSHDVMKQNIPDKSIADSMEALIGAHFIHCGYMGAMGFMTWLGVDVFHSEISMDDEHVTRDGRRKSPTPQRPSTYANYPLPSLEIPPDEDRQQYELILKEQTTQMALFEKEIKYEFQNKVLLLEAFTHPTYSENTITGSYQRLEFLGDAILDFLVTQHIYNSCGKDLKPGQLTDLRSALVNNNIFAVIAVKNNYNKYLKEYSPTLFTTIGHFVKGLSQYLENIGNKVIPDPYVIPVQGDANDVECIEAPKPLGDIFESVAGAIFLDSGLDIHTVWRVCYPMLKDFIDEYSKNVPKNPVRRVAELDEKAKFSSAKILEDERVSCVLKFEGENYEGIGRNKRNAKLSAAYKALKRNECRTGN